MNRPEPKEYDPYYEHYVSLVPEDNINPILAAQPSELVSLFANVSEERGTYAYEDGKWTIKEMIGHLIDGERMFAYRLLRISRGDKTPIEGFEQDGYIENANSNSRQIADLLTEFTLVREANMHLFNNLSDEGWLRVGTANNVEVTVRALAWIMAGHIRHHIDILKSRYLD